MKRMLALCLVASMLIGLIPICASAAQTDIKPGNTYIVLAPGNYTDNGAWKVETDSETGIKFMVAGVDNKPTPDKPAKIKVVLPKAGTYRIYAISKDFATAPGTRYYDVKLGDVGTFRTGDHGLAGWHWQGTEAFTSFGGEMEFSVIDVKGQYARSAMIVITDDLSFNPGNTSADLEALAAMQYKEGDLTFEAVDETAGRPSSEVAVKLNGEWMKFDVDPVVVNDRTMVPFRAIFEALGCTVEWDDENQTAIGVRNGMKIKLPIGEEMVTVGGKYTTLDQPAILLNDRTLVPLRFVSETLGAQVQWLEDSQSVIIAAAIPQESVLFTQKSFTEFGTWTMEGTASGAFNEEAIKGTIPNVGNAQPDDADASNTKPAVAEFNLAQGGTYKVWARSKDFATQNQGSRYFNVGFNDQPMMPHKYGTHGATAYAWASGGTVELKPGKNKLYVYDTSGYYARFDAIFITKDMNYVPSDSFDSICKVAMPYDNRPDVSLKFPNYAKELAEPTESASIENEHTKVVFYKVPTSNGQVVQNEIYSKHNGAWVKTNGREEELGYIVMRADNASYTTTADVNGMTASFHYQGQPFAVMSDSPYEAGIGTWFVPNDYTVSDNTVTLSFPATDAGTMTATWSLDEETAPKVSVDTTVAKDGFYSIGAWEGKEFKFDEFEYALAPFRVQYKRVPEKAQLLSEVYLFTPMGTYTLPKNNAYSAEPVTKGIVAEPSWIPQRWVYKGGEKFGITVNSSTDLYRGTMFAPVMGSEDSKMAAGSTYNMQYRVISTVADWFENYQSVTANLFDVTDYRKNYGNSLNEAIFNTRALMMDDVYGGWDVYDKAHYNMEGMNVTSVANSMQALQDYLLTEDEDILTRRAIPTLANTLTRNSIHFNRIGVAGGGAYWAELKEPQDIGKPVSGFNLNVIGGMYEMTRGAIPYLHEYGVEKGMQSVTNSYGSIAGFSNDLNLYKYTGDKKYLDAAINGADKYLEEVVYKTSTQIPDFSSFIYISYYPNLASMIDIYEVTKDKKYLDAAENIAQWMSTGLWVPGIDGEKKTAPLKVNDINEIAGHNHYSSETNPIFWWAGAKQFRIGRENLQDTTASNENITNNTKEVEGWIPSRVGLGVEQASTFGGSSNIVMQSFVGDFLKIAAYTGDDYYATIARNAIIGRFRSYDGYYRNVFETYTQETNYPYEGPDYTGIYWHHIPPFLAMLEDFLINQTFAWSGANISFPSLRQQGYAYFNSNQYGYAPGKFYDEADMWAWLDKGIVETNNIQIDWMAARKDGVLGLALMNEDDQDITTTVQLGDKVPGGASYTGTANLYDKSGKIGTVEVTNGAFSVTIPAKSLQAVTMQIAGVKAPAYSKVDYSATSAEIGGTVSDHTNGKGYALQMSPDCYYAYVYVTDKPVPDKAGNPKSLTMTYDIGGGAKQTVTTDVYPYEFIIKVDDVNKEFNYSLSLEKADGTKEDRGSGKLMTAALSAQKGIKYTSKAPLGSGSSVSEATKNLKFTPFQLVYSIQGSGGQGLRFVVDTNKIPFEVTENSMVGLPATGKVIDGGEEIPYETTIVANEMRGTDQTVIILAPTNTVTTSKYSSDQEGKTHKFEMTISPIE